MEQQVVAAMTALVLTLALSLTLAPVARRLGWADHPDWRKQHEGDIPLAGGPALFLAVVAVAIWQGGWSDWVAVLGWSSAVVFLTGLVDDRVHVRVPLRFALQIVALLGMVWYGDVKLYNFGRLFWDEVLGLGPLIAPITVFSALGVINAFNMIDGLDGLSGSLALVALGGLAFLAGRAGYVEAHALLLILAGGVLGFLLLNFRFNWRQRARVFFGDSGTSWLGFVLAWFFIQLSQHDPASGAPRAYAPITAVWLIGLPLMDTTYVMIRRARVGDPIFGADRRHLHHRFLRSGFTVRQTWSALVGASVVMALLGIAGELLRCPEWWMFYGYVALAFCYLVWMEWTRRTRRFFGRVIE